MSPYTRALLLLIAGTLFLYFYGANKAYGSDDVWSLNAVSQSAEAMMQTLRADVHPPLYFWMLRGWIDLFGESEVATRMLSILLCLGAAGFTFFAAREQFGNRAGLLALAVIAVSPIATVAAQLIRMYALLTLVSAASTWAFLRLLNEEARPGRAWCYYILANIAGSFTHVYFFFLLAGQGMVYLILHPPSREFRAVGWMIAAAVLSLTPYAIVWLPNLLGQMNTSSQAHLWMHTPNRSDLAGVIPFQGGLAIFVIPFLWKRRRSGTLSCFAIAAVTLAIPLIISIWKPLYAPRFAVAALPPFAIAMGGLAPRRDSEFKLECGIVASACLLAVILTAYASECSSRAAAEYLARNTRPGDTVVFSSLSRMPIDYYWKRMPHPWVIERSYPGEIDEHPGYEGAILTPDAKPRIAKEARALVAQETERSGRIFFLHGYRPEIDALLERPLGSLRPEPELAWSCRSMGSYFQYISAYSCAPPAKVAKQ